MKKINHSVKIGISFGITSGIITTLGMMVGLESSTHSKIAVIGGILTVAIADAFSDGLGIHVSEESENRHTAKEIWQSTFATFFSKLILATTFIVPILVFNLSLAVWASIAWGLVALAVMSYKVARGERKNPYKVISEHLLIAIAVVIITHYVGSWILKVFV